MNVERLRPVILSILDIELDRDQTVDMIIRVLGAAEPTPAPIPPAAHRSREVRLSDKRRTQPAAEADGNVRPLIPTDYYTAAEIAPHLGIGVESAYSLLQREPDAFPYQQVPNTGKGPKTRKVYLGRGIIQYMERRRKGRRSAVAADAPDPGPDIGADAA